MFFRYNDKFYTAYLDWDYALCVDDIYESFLDADNNEDVYQFAIDKLEPVLRQLTL